VERSTSGDTATDSDVVGAANPLITTAYRFLSAFGISLAYREPHLDQYRTICAVGYPSELTSFLNSDFVEEDATFRQVKSRPAELLSWNDFPDFRTSGTVRRWFLPYGVSEGISMILQDGEATVSGVLHVNLRRNVFPRRGMDLLEAMRPELEDLVAGARSRSRCPLSSREWEVLELIALGKTNDAMAGLLGISPSTVRTHVENILRKSNSSSRTEAVAKWWRQNPHEALP
jgi:DNA-binding CsgD family transcriptional regulator